MRQVDATTTTIENVDPPSSSSIRSLTLTSNSVIADCMKKFHSSSITSTSGLVAPETPIRYTGQSIQE